MDRPKWEVADDAIGPGKVKNDEENPFEAEEFHLTIAGPNFAAGVPSRTPRPKHFPEKEEGLGEPRKNARRGLTYEFILLKASSFVSSGPSHFRAAVDVHGAAAGEDEIRNGRTG